MSTFDQVVAGRDLIGLSPGPQFARLSTDGDLTLDPDAAALLRDDFISRLDDAYSEELRRRIEATTERARIVSSVEGRASEAVAALAHAGDVVSEVVTLVLLGKVLTPVLLEQVHRQDPHAPIPFPSPSPGSMLAEDLHELAISCTDGGYPPHRLAAEWPDVGPEAKKHVLRFADEHVGFGPLAWEAPGYDDPQFVVSALSTVRAIDRPMTPQTRATISRQVQPLYDALKSWLELLEYGIVFVRSAFHRTVLAAVVVFGQERSVHSTDVLFMTFDEISGAPPTAEEIQRRRTAYMGNTRYLAQACIEPDRLDRLVQR